MSQERSRRTRGGLKAININKKSQPPWPFGIGLKRDNVAQYCCYMLSPFENTAVLQLYGLEPDLNTFGFVLFLSPAWPLVKNKRLNRCTPTKEFNTPFISYQSFTLVTRSIAGQGPTRTASHFAISLAGNLEDVCCGVHVTRIGA